MGDVDLRVLGPVEIVSEAGPVRLAAMQTRLLAALVVGGGQARSLDELVEAVWDGIAPQSARKLVQVYVSQLRKVLPAEVAIQTVEGGYAARMESGALDSERFERLLRECGEAREAGNAALAASLIEQALALWRGRAYGELAYEDFARAEGERLEELRVEAIEERLAALLELGRVAEVLGDALAHAEGNALRERSHELAMLALYRAGRQADALEHYAALRTRLDDELGLEPGSALRELQRRILQQDPALDVGRVAAPSAQALPASPNELVGRDRELSALRALLDRRESRLIVLTGAGGSGKTRLAFEAARDSAGTFANGAVIVELAPLRDPDLVVHTIARALDIAVDPTEDPLAPLAAGLAPQELLLVVDNAEHVRTDAPAFAELVARVPRLTLLVTSRAVLHISGERVFPVVPLAEDDAVELFVQRAQLLDPSFERTPENDADTREICARLDCLPLAVELAAARIRTLTPRALRERLHARLRLLTGGPRDLPARQQTLRETIDWSVGLLDDIARAVFTRLAVFPAGASLDAAEAVCGAELDTLAALVDDHLLRREDAFGEPRFGMLETVREYALELLGEERPRAELAMLSYFVGLTERIESEAGGALEPLSQLDAEIDNIRAALIAAERNGASDLRLGLAGSMWRYHWARGTATEGIAEIEEALAASDGRATSRRARALQGAAGLVWSMGDLASAKHLASEAVRVASQTGSTWEECLANTVLGAAANDEHDPKTAREHHQRSLELAVELGVEPVVQKLNLGIVALDLGEFEEAQELLEDVLTSHRRAERPAGIGFALANLGLVRWSLGDHEGSRLAFEEARTCFEQVAMRQQVAYTLQGLAAAEAHESRFEEAARLLGEARRELDDIGSPEETFAAGLIEETKKRSRAALGDEAFEAAYAAGRENPG
ncbi:MAG: BTAD domain-containing putative transcriptional regulator [Gaiellaceae bacterium]